MPKAAGESATAVATIHLELPVPIGERLGSIPKRYWFKGVPPLDRTVEHVTLTPQVPYVASKGHLDFNLVRTMCTEANHATWVGTDQRGYGGFLEIHLEGLSVGDPYFVVLDVGGGGSLSIGTSAGYSGTATVAGVHNLVGFLLPQVAYQLATIRVTGDANERWLFFFSCTVRKL